MLGRPVVRSLVEAGLRVRALVRDAARAVHLLPEGVELVWGDVRKPETVESAMGGADAVYLSLNTPFARKATFDPDRDGTAVAVEAAQRVGVGHVLRLSALGVPDGSDEWWAIDRKRSADELRVRICFRV